MNDTAYYTNDPVVLNMWNVFLDAAEETRLKRIEMSERYDRGLMVNRSGFGHGTRVVGFERLADDKDGERERELVISSKRGANHGMAVPYLRSKAGKELAAELRTLDSPVLDLPGMPQFHIGGDGDGIGLRSMAPALWEHEGAMYAFWGTDTAPVGEPWEQIPLSAYYAAKEAMEKNR